MIRYISEDLLTDVRYEDLLMDVRYEDLLTEKSDDPQIYHTYPYRCDIVRRSTNLIILQSTQPDVLMGR